MLRSCPLPFVGENSIFRHTATCRRHTPPLTSRVLVTGRRSQVIGKNTWRHKFYATQSFVEALEENNTQYYFLRNFAAKADKSIERAELDICSALRSEDVELQSKVRLLMII